MKVKLIASHYLTNLLFQLGKTINSKNQYEVIMHLEEAICYDDQSISRLLRSRKAECKLESIK